MAESNSKSKLKRKKSSVEDTQHAICPRDTAKKKNNTGTLVSSSDRTAGASRSAWWWSRDGLPEAEALWVMTLKSALPHLDKQPWDLLPHLPPPSAARPTEAKSEEERWCSLSEEVAPLPGPSPPSPPSPSQSPCPLGLSSPQRDLAGQTKPAPDSPGPSSHSQGCHHSWAAGPLEAVDNSPRPSPHSCHGPPSPAGPPGAGEESDSDRVFEQEEEVQRDVGGGGGGGGGGGDGRLQSCPMCLMEFPAGFTQMDCDGHLAQCLSEVNVDMTW